MTCIRQILVLVLPVAALLSACGSTIPQIRVSRPWLRSLQTDSIKPGANIRTEVEGKTGSLLGEEELVHSALREQLDRLLERRGFSVVDHKPDYDVKLTYNVDKTGARVSRGRSFSGAAGVSIALQVADPVVRVASLNSVGYSVTRTERRYEHTFGVEFFLNSGELIWKGEAIVEEVEPNVIESARAALQLALSGLPVDTTYIPTAPIVKESHALNYFTQECDGKLFSCPALPYFISFRRYDPHDRLRRSLGEQTGLHDEELVAAYKDIVTSAEFALPIGRGPSENPADPDHWAEVLLGGRYSLEPGGQIAHVIVRLKGESEGYVVREAHEATDEEYRQFESRIDDWKLVLKDYFDFFE